jgi:hypothetical protein
LPWKTAGFPRAGDALGEEVIVSTIAATTTRAGLFSVGFNTSVGFSGTGQTGYSTSAEINFGLPVKGWSGQVCGQNNDPSATSPGPGVVLVPN